jgi:hypothetical protein
MKEVLALFKEITVIAASEAEGEQEKELCSLFTHAYELSRAQQVKANESRKLKARTLPLIFQQELHQEKVSPGTSGQTKLEAAERLQKLTTALEKLQALCVESAYPLRICGKRRNCCGLKMRSLFHETK